MADPCSAAYRSKLGEEYLKTVDGRTSVDPVGLWCTAGDVSQWRLAVLRIRAAMADTAQENKGVVKWSKSLKKRVTKWIARSLKIKGGKIPRHLVVRLCEEDVQKAVTFARKGAGLLADMHCEAFETEGGVVPDPPPKSRHELDTGLPGPDWAWGAGAALIGLGLVAVIRGQK